MVVVGLLAAALVSAAAAAPVEKTQVAGLQVALRANGVYHGRIDGVPGPATRRAVLAFQRRQQLTADGIAGRRTRRALGRLGVPLFGNRTIVRGMRGWDVAVLQFELARRGLRVGRIDGSFGSRTERALRRFQRARGLAVDGIAGRATLTALARRRHVRRLPRIPRYLVRPGDTLTAIAARHRTTVAALARANRLDPGRILLPRMRLRIVGSRPAAAGRATRATVPVRVVLGHWAARYGVDPRLVRALAWQESGFQPHVVSAAGAFGVMQVTPATWKFVETVLLGRPVARTTEGNIRIGVAFLDHLLELFGDERRALAAYYQGARAVRERGILPETRVYVANVLALRRRM